jgi:hypothetical protein
MKKILFLVLFISVLPGLAAHAGMFDSIMKEVGRTQGNGPDDSTTASGLKEALSISTERAVEAVSKENGYFGNEMIKILMPEKIQKVGDVLSKVGFDKEVDAFVLSMNRAAEKAAPKAAGYFGDAIKEMTFEDAKKILNGGDTAATEFFREKTHDKLYDAFKPEISSSLDEVGATRSYKDMMTRYESLPLMSSQSLDLDHYVTDEALDGLFYMVGQEEKKIRTDPAARATDLLKQVFGK